MADFEIDTSQVAALAQRLERFADGQWRTGLMGQVGEELVELVREGFERQADPYGAPWAPLKRRSGRILQDTGRLRMFFVRSKSASMVRVGTPAFYGRFHQTGTKHMPARKMVPDGALPGAWSSRVNAIVERVIKQAMR